VRAQYKNTHLGVFVLCLYTTQLERIFNLEANSHRAERVVVLYLYMRIRVRGGATQRARAHRPQQPQNFLPFSF
jgi:hypothetical protein